MNLYLVIIIAALAVDFLLDSLADWLNLRALKEDVPAEFAGVYDAQKYSQSQRYLKDNTVFGRFRSTFLLAIILGLIFTGGFSFLDRFSRSFAFNEIITGLIFCGILFLAGQVIAIPFSAYHTFVIEAKYGFNRTKLKTFIADIFKGWLLSALIGLPLLALVLWFFQSLGALAWVYCWLVVTLVELFLVFISPVWIMPLFNKFTPLPEGELKSAIVTCAAKAAFALAGVYTMDGSRRSAKSNAFFTGLGRFRRIALFDTLVAKHTTQELVAVLAHEIGHYKLRHIAKMLAASVINSGVMFFILSRFIGNSGLAAAFGVAKPAIYSSLVFFGFLWAPLNLVLGIFANAMSRRHEYQADAFAARLCGASGDFISALKKLSVDNLTNLTPHPFKVFLEYTHPPVLARIRALNPCPNKTMQ